MRLRKSNSCSDVAKTRLGPLKVDEGREDSVERAWESRAHVEEEEGGLSLPLSIPHFKDCLDNEIGANLK